jgi:nicotinate dehydrogenase subunit B
MTSRREFLKSSGALVVSFGAAAVLEPFVFAQRGAGGGTARVNPQQLDSWIAVSANGTVTVYTGKVELGQGMLTAQTQLVAEELFMPVDRITVIQGDTDVSPDQGTTSGSQSTPTNFNDRNLALAAATAREALLKLGADRLGAAPDALTIADGTISLKSDPSKRVTYGELVAGRKFNLPLDTQARRRNPADWRVLGKPVPRVDMTTMAAGTFEFVHNVKVPGMLHGVVIRPPAVGASLQSVDESSVRDLPGVVKVVVKKDFLGVVAEKPYQARQAATALKAVWSSGSGLRAQSGLYSDLRTQPSRDAFVVNSKDVDEKLGSAASVVKATYLHPYQMHGSMGTSCAVADVRGTKVTVWSPTQSPSATKSGVAMVLGLAADDVHVIYTRGSGCYGINGADTVSYDAALLSQAAGKPVRVQLSRKDEMAWENYGFPYVIDQRAGVDRDGNIVAWDCETWNASRGGRPGANTPGNVITGLLAGFAPAAFAPRAAQDPGSFSNGSNAAPSYLAGRAGGRSGGAGTVASERVLTHSVLSPFFTGPLRSPSRLQNTFAHESFIDEVAAQVKADPIAYRLRHISDPRLKEVLAEAAKAAKWETRPSPRPNLRRTGVVSGRGAACVVYEGDNGYVAMIAEVDVDRSTGKVTARRFVVAQDCGPISNPDGMRNQIEGGALQGLSRALGEEVTWDDQKITSIDWRMYHSLTLGADVPAIESVLINRTDAPAMGAGETTITIVAAAVGNAIFDATGVRLRQVPFTAERIKSALA